ncbi:MAG TPA: BON domain-containing protein [Rhodocyclaceae bacterium]
MRRNRLTYALPVAALLAIGASARLALADDPAGSSDPGYTNADPSRPNDTMSGSATPRDMHDRSSSSMERSSSGHAMSDAAITTKVKSALLAERGLPSSQIKVQTNDGTVQLSGFLNSQAEIDRAVQVARNVKDVKSVENNLQTK